MRDDHNESAVAAHGIGAVLAGVLSLFARSADDVARMGVHCVDDVGRACVTATDDIGTIMSRSGDDLLRPVDDFYVPNYLDDVRVEISPARVAVNEDDEGLAFAPHLVKEVAEATIKIVDLDDRDDDN